MNLRFFCVYSFQNNLCNLLRVRARLVEKQYSLYKLHANYGRVFSEWSAIEREMGDGLQVFEIYVTKPQNIFISGGTKMTCLLCGKPK